MSQNRLRSIHASIVECCKTFKHTFLLAIQKSWMLITHYLSKKEENDVRFVYEEIDLYLKYWVIVNYRCGTWTDKQRCHINEYVPLTFVLVARSRRRVCPSHPTNRPISSVSFPILALELRACVIDRTLQNYLDSPLLECINIHLCLALS
jgi:hypothetical protein